MIEVINLSKTLAGRRVVKEVSFSVDKGQVLGLLGPNGAGKSTTLRMLTTLLYPTSGTAHIGGLDLLEQGVEIRKLVGYLPEEPPLYPSLRVREYLSFWAELRGLNGGPKEKALSRAIEMCQIGDVRNQLCDTLSKGYRQRVGLAQSIIHTPQVLVLDEPTNGLDPEQVSEMRTLIRSLVSDMTVMLSTHVLPEVKQLCDKVVILAGGRIVREQLMSEILGEGELEDVFLNSVAS